MTRYTRPPGWPWFYAAALGVTLAAAAVGWAGSALGHEAPSGWRYEAWCCNAAMVHPNGAVTGDCAPLPRGAVRVDREGYHVSLAPGEHPTAPNGGQWTVRHHVGSGPNNRIRPSGDEHYHGCILPGSQTMQCIYRPEGGV
jgi:hypothetical protein